VAPGGRVIAAPEAMAPAGTGLVGGGDALTAARSGAVVPCPRSVPGEGPGGPGRAGAGPGDVGRGTEGFPGGAAEGLCGMPRVEAVQATPSQ
jgi:hypothetical protein